MSVTNEARVEEFSFIRDFKLIAWKPTLIHNLLRSIAAGLVWGTIIGFAESGFGAFIGITIALPLLYFVFFLPIGLAANWLDSVGVPFARVVAGLVAWVIIVGDPLVWSLSRFKPELVPCKDPKLFPRHLIIFIVNELADDAPDKHPSQVGSSASRGGRGQQGLMDEHSDDQSDPLLEAISDDDIDSVKALLANGMDTIVRTGRGVQLLQFTTIQSKAKMSQILLDAGVAVNERAGGGDTPLTAGALFNSDTNTMMVLINNGADVNAANDKGKTALMHAAGEGNVQLTSLLLEHGADARVAEADGFTAIHIAAINGQPTGIPVLVKAGGDANARSRDGSTPLLAAALCGYVECVKTLLECGADESLTNDDGRSAAELAQYKGYSEIVEMLEGANDWRNPI